MKWDEKGFGKMRFPRVSLAEIACSVGRGTEPQVTSPPLAPFLKTIRAGTLADILGLGIPLFVSLHYYILGHPSWQSFFFMPLPRLTEMLKYPSLVYLS